jgi:probable rRNA maturation factor
MRIYINNDTDSDLEKYYDGARAACEAAAGKDFNAEIGITFVDDDIIREMNKIYRDNDAVTDVLSFPADEAPDGTLYGDIFICYNQAMRQAVEIGSTETREIIFLTVHGTLHLLGYDHSDEQSENIMINKQKEIISSIGGLT